MLLVAGSTVACEGGSVPFAGTRLAITGGAADVAHPATVALVTVSPLCGEYAPPPAAFCTGTLIAPRVVLTAAHCVDEALPSTMRIVSAESVDAKAIAGGAQPVAVTIHPDYVSAGVDLAMLLLDEPLAAAPVPLASVPLAASDVGRTVTVVGFGLDDAGPAGVTGVRRGGTATISAVGESSFVIVAAPAMSCGGDSGGPVLIDEAGTEVVAGVTSTGGATCESGGNQRVDAYRELIDLVVARVQSGGPPRRPVMDLRADYCAGGCESDGDCPATMECATRADGSRSCGLGGLPAGTFGDGCDESCEGGTCVSTDAGCRCWLPCDGDRGGAAGCASVAGGAQGRGSWVLVMVMLMIGRRRRRHDP